ncbi:MarR family winged helix-turn-helix transcriptional regulator [Azospirillum griseum]|uniref:MarR family transcriptional regulator n=1 Tax=Azospirillum griseum TaxID=2496639 RepID=A0A3S0K3C2_9PROT|nr:MarR family winged helix-turn-helix transcriptional regulator [Azospirillum griseum]RTR18631.1 MarR family transcriptional regulator [Azospirillum griseum]
MTKSDPGATPEAPAEILPEIPVEDGGKFTRKRMRRNWPFYWISRVNARYVQVLETRLKPINLDMPRWRVLMSLHEDEHLSVSEIAEFSVLKLNTATKIVQRMLADGLVVTRTSPVDARATEVSLTPHGDRMRQLAMVEADRILASSFLDIPPEDIATLNTLLQKVFNQLGEM